MVILKEFNISDKEKEFEFLRNLKPENGFKNDYYGKDIKEMDNVINQLIDCSKGKNIPDGYVACTYFALWQDDQIVGLFKVRHYLSQQLRQGAGHIGYAIAPQFRGKGFATLGLKMAIEKLVKMKDFVEDEVYLSCSRDNVGSLKAMQHNGGYIHHFDDTKNYVRIKVNK